MAENRVYGYCRVSTKFQSIERQIRNIRAEYPEAEIFQDAYTGRTLNRPSWNEMQKQVRTGDTIIFDSVSRMSRNAEEGVSEYFSLVDKGITLVFLKEHYIDSEVYRENLKDKIALTGQDEDAIFIGINNYFRLLAERQIKIAFEQAQKEVDDLSKRTSEGMQTAKLKGHIAGRRYGSKFVSKKKEKCLEFIKQNSRAFGGTLTVEKIAGALQVNKCTVVEYTKILRAEEIGKCLQN